MLLTNLKPGKGLEVVNGELTLRFDPSINVQKESSGVYIDANALGGGLEGTIDDHTVEVKSVDSNGNAIIGINRDVVTCVFSMCQYQVTNRSNTSTYTTNTTIKTISDIGNELNAVMDAYGTIGIPMGVPHYPYQLQIGDFFQLRTRAMPYQYTDGTNTWPVAVDSGNRPEGIPIVAFFYVSNVVYSSEGYLETLSLQCLWSSLTQYTKGTTYTFTHTT